MTNRTKRLASKRTLENSSPLLKEEECALRKALYASLKSSKGASGDGNEESKNTSRGKYGKVPASMDAPKGKRKLTKGSSTESITKSAKIVQHGNRRLKKVTAGSSSIGKLKKERRKILQKSSNHLGKRQYDDSDTSDDEPTDALPVRMDRVLQAQRKFAQSTPCSPNSLLARQIATVLPERPKTEDFIKYLCLRGTPHLPSRLSVFSNPCLPPSPLSSDDDIDCSLHVTAQNSFSPIQSAAKTSSQREKETDDDASEWLTLTDSGMVYIPHQTTSSPGRAARSAKKNSSPAVRKKSRLGKSSSRQLTYNIGKQNSHDSMSNAKNAGCSSSEVIPQDNSGSTISKSSSQRGSRRNSPTTVDLNVNLYEKELHASPVLRPMESDFRSAAKYIVKTNNIVIKFGGGIIVPPEGWSPPSTIDDDIRFNTRLQHIHSFRHRLNPTTRKLRHLQAYFEQASIPLDFNALPQIGGCAVDLSALGHAVQTSGGFEKINSIKKWLKIADVLKLPKSAQGKAAKLEDIYIKYILPYHSLPDNEKRLIEEQVNKKLNGNSDCLHCECPEVKGKSVSLVSFHRLSCNTMEMYGGDCSSVTDYETQFWEIVNHGKRHIAVFNGTVDANHCGASFQVSKSKSGWSLLSLPLSNGSALKYIGGNHELTSPILKFECIFSTSGWIQAPWGCHVVDYLHTGADKVWYTIPSCVLDTFLQCMKRLAPELYKCRNEASSNVDWIQTALVSPIDLMKDGCPVARMVQKEGQFVVLLPDVYYCSISTGYSCSEHVCFAPMTWLSERILSKKGSQMKTSLFSIEKILLSIAKEEVDKRRPLSVIAEVLDQLRSIQHKEQLLRRTLTDLGVLTRDEVLCSPGSRQKRGSGVDWRQCHSCGKACYISYVEEDDATHLLCLSDAADLKASNPSMDMTIVAQMRQDDLDSIVAQLSDKVLHLNDKDGESQLKDPE